MYILKTIKRVCTTVAVVLCLALPTIVQASIIVDSLTVSYGGGFVLEAIFDDTAYEDQYSGDIRSSIVGLNIVCPVLCSGPSVPHYGTVKLTS